MSQELSQFDQLKSDITEFVAPVSQLKVMDFKSSQQAIEVAKAIKSYLSQLEKTRKMLVDPHNQVVKRVNAYAKTIEEPLLKAEEHVKRELQLFAAEQERIREAEQRKADEERRRLAAELEAKQEAEREAALADQDVALEAAGIFGCEIVKPTQDLTEQHRLEQVEAEIEHQRRTWDIDQRRIKNTRKQWKAELVDIDLVPREFLTITLNTKAVLDAARQGRTDIPGVRVFQEIGVAIGATTYVPRAAIGEE